MAEDLIARHTKKLRLKNFKDSYQERLLTMLKAKVAEVKQVELPAAAAITLPADEALKLDEAITAEMAAPATMKRKMAKAPLPAKAEKKRKAA